MKKNPLNTREFPCEVKKILRKMRITLLFVLLLGFYAEASSQKVTLNMKNTNLYSVLQQLKNQTGVRMLYDADYTKQIKCKDATFQAEDLAVVLVCNQQNTGKRKREKICYPQGEGSRWKKRTHARRDGKIGRDFRRHGY